MRLSSRRPFQAQAPYCFFVKMLGHFSRWRATLAIFWQNFTSTQCLSSKKSLLPIQSPNKFLKQNEARILSCQSHQAVQAWLAQDLSILNWQHCHSHHAQCFFLLTHCTYVTVSSLNHDWHALFCLSDPGMHTQFWHTFWMVHQVMPDLKNQKERCGPWNCRFFPKIDQQPVESHAFELLSPKFVDPSDSGSECAGKICQPINRRDKSINKASQNATRFPAGPGPQSSRHRTRAQNRAPRARPSSAPRSCNLKAG